MYLNEEFEGYDGETMKRDKVCALEIWVEVFNGDRNNFKAVDARNINDIMREMPGWERSKSTIRFGKIYGTQRGYVRKK